MNFKEKKAFYSKQNSETQNIEIVNKASLIFS